MYVIYTLYMYNTDNINIYVRFQFLALYIICCKCVYRNNKVKYNSNNPPSHCLLLTNFCLNVYKEKTYVSKFIQGKFRIKFLKILREDNTYVILFYYKNTHFHTTGKTQLLHFNSYFLFIQTTVNCIYGTFITISYFF